MRKSSIIGPHRCLSFTLLSVSGICTTHSCAAETSITIYSSTEPGGIPAEMYRPVRSSNPYAFPPQQQVPGYAVVRQAARFELQSGINSIRFTDVAALLDPTTVSFISTTDPATTVLEQNFLFDLVSNEKLMERFIGMEIAVTLARGDKPERVVGTLLSSSAGGAVLQTDDGRVHSLTGVTGVELPKLPGGLITRPTLNWSINAKTPGRHDARISYQTEGITWWADYNLLFTEGKDANTGTLDVAAWVSILNRSGATYSDARLKLIAGDVARAPRPRSRHEFPARSSEAMSVPDESSGFEQKAFFEYHLYTLGRPVTITDNSTKQLELFPSARGVECEKTLLYDGLADAGWYGYGSPLMDQGYGTQTKKDVDVYLKFINSAERGMGMPLPAGRIRVSKLDPKDQSLEFIGEGVIRHTPRNENVLVRLGKAFDVVGERRQTDFRLDSSRRQMDETIEIKVRNRKNEPVKVIVQERMHRWTTWDVLQQSQAHSKIDSQTIHFPLTIAKDGEAVVTYKVRYTW